MTIIPHQMLTDSDMSLLGNNLHPADDIEPGNDEANDLNPYETEVDDA